MQMALLLAFNDEKGAENSLDNIKHEYKQHMIG